MSSSPDAAQMALDSSRGEPAQQPDVPGWIQSAIDAATDLKALDLRLLSVEGLCDFADYFLICSGRSDRQVEAIGDAVEERLREAGQKAMNREGQNEGKWVLLDYGDFVVHVFDPLTRDFYRLDQLWGDAPILAQGSEGEASFARQAP